MKHAKCTVKCLVHISLPFCQLHEAWSMDMHVNIHHSKHVMLKCIWNVVLLRRSLNSAVVSAHIAETNIFLSLCIHCILYTVWTMESCVYCIPYTVYPMRSMTNHEQNMHEQGIVHILILLHLLPMISIHVFSVHHTLYFTQTSIMCI